MWDWNSKRKEGEKEAAATKTVTRRPKWIQDIELQIQEVYESQLRETQNKHAKAPPTKPAETQI